MTNVADAYFVGVLAASAAFISLGILVLRSGSSSLHIRLWGSFCFLMAATALCIAVTTRLGTVDHAVILARLGFSFAAATVVTLFAFALAFAGLARRMRWVLGLPVGVALVLQALLWGTDTVVKGVKLDAFGLSQPVAGPWMPLHLLLVASTLIATAALLVLLLARSSGRQRLQVLYIFAAIAIIALASAGSLAPLAEGGSLVAITSAFLIILAPSLITYAIIRHQLWDIRTVVHRTALWLGASSLVVVPLYFALKHGSSRLATGGTTAWGLTAFGLLLLFALHFRVVQPWVDHRFARRRHDPLTVLDRFNRDALHLRGARELGELIVSTVTSALYTSFARVCVVDADSPQIRLAAGAPCASCILDERCRTWLAAHDGPIDLSLIHEIEPGAEPLRCAAQLRQRDAVIALPLVQDGKLLGLLTLGEKRLLRAFTREDFLMLERIRPPATVALANARLYDRLNELTVGLEQRVEQRTRELREANEKLLELDRLKTKFFANITHELRTPLTLILAPLEDLLLREESRIAGLGEDLRSMHRNAQRLLRHIDGLLDLAQIDAGSLRLRLASLHLNPMLEAAARSFRGIARKKGVSIAISRLVDGDDTLLADAEKLDLVLGNLLANAVKFTPEGGRIELAAEAGPDDALRLRVRDTGIGIPADQLERIFDRFAQVESGTTRRYEGAGIGLSLVREIVGLHQGHVTVTSKLGEGSEFCVELLRKPHTIPHEVVDRREIDIPAERPRRVSDRVPPAGLEAEGWLTVEREEPPRELGVEPHVTQRVMIVEDNPDMRTYLERRLRHHFRIVSCADGKEALAQIVERPPDLVVADVMMPELSGFELCRRIKASPVTAAVPVILLTAHRSLDRTLEGFQSGADDYLTKPFNVHELMARIGVQLKLVELGRRLALQEKTAVFNLVAAGLAHEVRNPVNAILNAARPLGEIVGAANGAPGDVAAIHELLGVIVESAERIDLLIADFLGLARASADEAADWKLAEALDSTLRVLRYKHGRAIALERRLEHARPPFGRTAQLNQVLLNLLDNAARAAGPQGRITVASWESDGRFHLAVRDDGPGIPPGYEERIFDPLFTTRESADATGLGLYLSRRIIESHGGRIRACRGADRGAELTVELPLDRN
jgi:signal transduction histidine kinase